MWVLGSPGWGSQAAPACHPPAVGGGKRGKINCGEVTQQGNIQTCLHPGFQNSPAHPQQGVTCSAGPQQAQGWTSALAFGTSGRRGNTTNTLGTPGRSNHCTTMACATSAEHFSQVFLLRLSLLKPKAQLLGVRSDDVQNLLYICCLLKAKHSLAPQLQPVPRQQSKGCVGSPV